MYGPPPFPGTRTCSTSSPVAGAGIPAAGRRTDRADGTAEMAELTVEMNEALGSTLDEKTTRLIRRKGYYVSTGSRE